MAPLREVKEVVKKIAGYDGVGEHVCFFGGAMPYILAGEESNRDHSDIDVLVDEKYMGTIREILKEEGLYSPHRDSGEMNLDQDYGIKVFINDIYVEFEPFTMDNNELTRVSFNPDKKLAGIETTPYLVPSDLIIPVEIDGIKTYSQSPEYIKAGKEKYRREKDLRDAEFIGQTPTYDEEKFARAQKSVEHSKEEIHSFEEIKRDKASSI